MNITTTQSLPHILIVDDNPENLRIAAETLSKSISCDLAFATYGQQALMAVDAELPDLILLDVMMPGMDGIEVCKILKNNSRTADIPVLFLTAKSESRDIVCGFEAGAADYIAKPFNGPELVARVRTHLRLRESATLIQQQKEEVGQLVRILCHDLVNPLGNLKNLIELLDSPDDFWTFKEDMQLMANTGLTLIEIVRKLKALEEGKVNIELKSEDLAQLCNRAIQMVRQRLQEKDVTVEIEIPPGVEVQVEPTLFLHSIMCNLLTNAIKFSPRQSIVRLACHEEGTQHIRLSVSDSGVGIPPALLIHLFDPSSHTTRMGTEGEVGTGFGMLLAKKTVEMFGGTITVESRDTKVFPHNHGTNVSLSLLKGNMSSPIDYNQGAACRTNP